MFVFAIISIFPFVFEANNPYSPFASQSNNQRHNIGTKTILCLRRFSRLFHFLPWHHTVSKDTKTITILHILSI